MSLAGSASSMDLGESVNRARLENFNLEGVMY